MQIQPQVTFKEIDRSDEIEARVRERIKGLEKVSDRITSCHVRVRAPHQRHRKGAQYVIDIDVITPSGSVHIGREPGDNFAHEDVNVAIRDAFNAAERKLRKLKERHKGRPEVLSAPLQGRIEVLDPEDGFGQIATTDGRLIYFHKHSLVGGTFSDLTVGDVVELSIDYEDSDEGPHASMVRPISTRKFVDKPG